MMMVPMTNMRYSSASFRRPIQLVKKVERVESVKGVDDSSPQLDPIGSHTTSAVGQ